MIGYDDPPKGLPNVVVRLVPKPKEPPSAKVIETLEQALADARSPDDERALVAVAVAGVSRGGSFSIAWTVPTEHAGFALLGALARVTQRVHQVIDEP